MGEEIFRVRGLKFFLIDVCKSFIVLLLLLSVFLWIESLWQVANIFT